MRVAAVVSHWRSVSFPEAGPPLSQVVMVAHESLYPTDWVGPRPKVILLIWTLLASSSVQDTLPRAGHPHRGSAGSWLVLAFTSWGPKPLPPLPPKLLSFLSLGAERTDYPNPLDTMFWAHFPADTHTRKQASPDHSGISSSKVGRKVILSAGTHMADKLLLQELILDFTPLLSHFTHLSFLILIP